MEDEKAIQQLVDLGFPIDQVRSALETTGNDFNGAAELLYTTLNSAREEADDAPTVSTERHKMVIVVRQDLGMSVGKIAAQCCHAAIEGAMEASDTAHDIWDDEGQPVIILKGESLDQVMTLMQTAQALDVPCHAVHDAGRTEVASGTLTCFSLGPAPSSQIDVITGHLALLK